MSGIQEWTFTAAQNTTIDGINIAENCPAANINNAIRAVMSDVMQEISYLGSDISASASISLAGVGWRLSSVTGSASILSFGSGRAGLHRELFWNGPSTIVASANNLTDGATNIVTATNDVSILISRGSGAWRVLHFPVSAQTVGTANIADGAVTLPKLAPMTAGKLLGASNGTAVEEIAIGSGLSMVAGVLSTGSVSGVYTGTYSANADLSTALPVDDTVPTSSEGTQIISVGSIVVATGQTVVAHWKGFGGATAGSNISATLFRDTTILDATNATLVSGSETKALELKDVSTPGAGTYTYSVRVGPASGAARLNGTSAGRLFGGAAKATLTVIVS